MNVPDNVREEMKRKLWSLADALDWLVLSPSAKTRLYEEWTRDPDIGGLLSRYLDKGQVRVYIKDSLLKDYASDRLADPDRIYRILDIHAPHDSAEVYIKPHGRRLKDGRVICWGRGEDWKMVLLAAHERAYLSAGARPHAAILLHAKGRFQDESARKMIMDAGEKLGIEKLVWLDM